ncbi:DUF1513 domain-containing protein [Magnetospirillum gryphiswaldense]|nr:DUF1513 domain-containing protein [Magnetospirillum gryphiswaldense]AVM74277.1 hypothetical protein MSR1_17850 [Magnetospirillum gryphiswaldense MSR-1]AVM78180.1 hypothetical protein MSR1L_17850 [Magnetospirillum gryphiswaldense]
MDSMVIDRRAFLAAIAAFGLMGKSPVRAEARRRLWLAANLAAGRQYGLGAFDAGGRMEFEVTLPGRGHGIALAPDGKLAVAVARRPGTFAGVIDVASGEATHWLEAPTGRHFHGHGAFSGDGRRFFSAENDYAEATGVIGIWDVGDTWRRVGEMPSHGIEPHDIRMLTDGHTLVVANGGIITHPDSGRARLNLERMDSSLVYLDSRDGGLLGQWRLPARWKLLSMRHFTVNDQGDVAIGMQYQDDDTTAPIIALHRFGQPIRLLDLPAPLPATVRNYCGSVAMSADGRYFAASCPQASLVTLWETTSARFLGTVAVADGCGVAAGGDGDSVLMTSGRRGAWLWSAQTGTVEITGAYVRDRSWDNHAVRLLL